MYPPSSLAAIANALPPFTTKKRALNIIRKFMVGNPSHIPTANGTGLQAYVGESEGEFFE